MFLERRVAAQNGEKLAMVLDIDETSLSNYSLYETTDMGRIQRLFDQWVQSTQARAIESTLRLFQKAQLASCGRLLHQRAARRPEDGEDQGSREVEMEICIEEEADTSLLPLWSSQLYLQF